MIAVRLIEQHSFQPRMRFEKDRQTQRFELLRGTSPLEIRVASRLQGERDDLR